MAISLELRFEDVDATQSESQDDDGATLRYVALTDAGESEADVRAYAIANIPTIYDGLGFTKVGVKRKADAIFDITATYEPLNSPYTLPALEPDEVRYSIRSGSSGSMRRTYSDSLISETVATGMTEYEFSGTAVERVIGIKHTSDGLEVEGVDVPTGQIELSLETVKDNTAISGGWLVTLAEYANAFAFNSATYKGFAAGTLQIVDYQASQRGGSNPDWDISISMIYSRNLTSINVGNGITVPSKLGHDYLDVLFARKVINGLPLSVPVRAAVHRLYPYIDFNVTLGI